MAVYKTTPDTLRASDDLFWVPEVNKPKSVGLDGPTYIGSFLVSSERKMVTYMISLYIPYSLTLNIVTRRVYIQPSYPRFLSCAVSIRD